MGQVIYETTPAEFSRSRRGRWTFSAKREFAVLGLVGTKESPISLWRHWLESCVFGNERESLKINREEGALFVSWLIQAAKHCKVQNLECQWMPVTVRFGKYLRDS
jgi:hypothetical protein